MRAHGARHIGSTAAAVVLLGTASAFVGSAGRAAADAAEAEVPAIVEAGGEAVPDQYIVTLAPDVPDQAVDGLADELAADVGGELLGTGTEAIDGFVVRADEADVEALLADPRVERVEEDAVVTGDATQADPPWNLDRID